MLVGANGEPLDCFECDGAAEHQHHVVPRSRGGTQTVPLCHDCHDLVHFRTDDASSLLRSAYLQARAAVQIANVAARSAPVPDAEVEIDVTDSDRWAANQPGADPSPEFYARLRAKVRARH